MVEVTYWSLVELVQRQSTGDRQIPNRRGVLALRLVENVFVKWNSNGRRIGCCNDGFDDDDDKTGMQCVGRSSLRGNQEVELSDSVKILIDRRCSIT